MTHSDMINDAICFAVSAHAGKVRKGSQIPAVFHALETAGIAATMCDDVVVITAAILHDTIEDTPVTAEQLQERFPEALPLVLAETENKRPDRPKQDTWRTRKQETVDFLQHQATRNEKIIALSDKLSNIRSTWRNYQMIGDEVWQRFNVKDKKEHEWYNRSVLKATVDLSDQPAWKEFGDLVAKLFG